MMRTMKQLVPRRVADIICLFVVVFFVPVVFLFEMSVVLPAVYLKGTFMHNFTFMLAMFIMSNLKGNMLACLMTDTSVDHQRIRPPENAISVAGWHMCDKCEKISPPRSWHCDICHCCILKRDHHCPFTGCCVGHKNQRYFMLFVFYLLIGSVYAFAYNTYFLFVLKAAVYRNWFTAVKMMCPALMLLTGFSEYDIYLFLYSLNILAIMYSVVLFVYHGRNILRGEVSFERGKANVYDAGWKQNLRTTFGKRMYLVWISPLISSKLAHNGLQWRQKRN